MVRSCEAVGFWLGASRLGAFSQSGVRRGSRGSFSRGKARPGYVRPGKLWQSSRVQSMSVWERRCLARRVAAVVVSHGCVRPGLARWAELWQGSRGLARSGRASWGLARFGPMRQSCSGSARSVTFRLGSVLQRSQGNQGGMVGIKIKRRLLWRKSIAGKSTNTQSAQM